jgi:hypothetical protein
LSTGLKVLRQLEVNLLIVSSFSVSSISMILIF